MLDLANKLVETAAIIPTTTNRYGDLVYGTPVTVSCLFRDISTLAEANWQENITIQGIFWFPKDTVANKGDVISYYGEFYLIEKVIRAKRLLLTDELSFIKCEVSRQKQIS